MAGFRIEVQGLDQATRKVKSLLSALQASEVEKVLVEGAKIVKSEAAQRAPVRTGRLKKGVKARKGKRRGKTVSMAFSAVDVKIAPHAYLVEYGTRHNQARPYFTPAVEATRDQVKRKVEEGLLALVKGAVR